MISKRIQLPIFNSSKEVRVVAALTELHDDIKNHRASSAAASPSSAVNHVNVSQKHIPINFLLFRGQPCKKHVQSVMVLTTYITIIIIFQSAVPNPLESISATGAIGHEMSPLAYVEDGLSLRRQALLHLRLEAPQHERTKNSMQLVNHLLLCLFIVNLQIKPLFAVINIRGWYTGMERAFPRMTYVDILCEKLAAVGPGGARGKHKKKHSHLPPPRLSH